MILEYIKEREEGKRRKEKEKQDSQLIIRPTLHLVKGLINAYLLVCSGCYEIFTPSKWSLSVNLTLFQCHTPFCYYTSTPAQQGNTKRKLLKPKLTIINIKSTIKLDVLIGKIITA